MFLDRIGNKDFQNQQLKIEYSRLVAAVGGELHLLKAVGYARAEGQVIRVIIELAIAIKA